MTDDIDPERGAVLDRHIKGLGKHFDCVLIIGSYMDELGRTKSLEIGHGNHYARIEMARAYARRNDDRELAGHLAVALDAVVEDIDDDEDNDDDEKVS